MDIHYDPIKNARNIRDRGLSFECVADFDFNSALIEQDVRKEYPELRMNALGLIERRLYALTFTPCAQGIRVISFRKANSREVRRYVSQD